MLAMPKKFSPSITPEKEKPQRSVVLENFHHLAFFPRFFGYFPLINLGSRINSPEELRFRLRPDILFTLLSVGMNIFNDVTFIQYNIVMKVSDFKEYMVNAMAVAYRLASLIILLHFVYKNKSLILYFQRWSEIDHDLENRSRDLKYLSRKLTAFSVFHVCLYLTGILTYGLKPANDAHKILDLISVFYVVICSNFSFAFMATFIVYFSSCISWGFESLVQDLDHIIKFQKHFPNMQSRLSSIRRRHEKLILLVEELNDILSHSLSVFILCESITACVGLYETCALIINRSPATDTLKTAIFPVARLLPLIIICYAANSIKNKSAIGVKKLNNSSLNNLSRESEFQIGLLIFQFQNRKAQLVASDIAVIDYRLMAEIFGLMVTYIVIMIEIGEDSKGIDGQYNKAK